MTSWARVSEQQISNVKSVLKELFRLVPLVAQKLHTSLHMSKNPKHNPPFIENFFFLIPVLSAADLDQLTRMFPLHASFLLPVSNQSAILLRQKSNEQGQEGMGRQQQQQRDMGAL